MQKKEAQAKITTARSNVERMTRKEKKKESIPIDICIAVIEVFDVFVAQEIVMKISGGVAKTHVSNDVDAKYEYE